MRKCFGILIAVLAILACAFPALAESDGSGKDPIDIYYHYFIPLQPGASNCYGAYRFLDQRGVENLMAMAGRRFGQLLVPGTPGGGVKPFDQSIVSYHDMKDVYRDDVVVLTDFDLTKSYTVTTTDYIYHHIYHYETPALFVGYHTVMNPVAGVCSPYNDGLDLVLIDRALMARYTAGFKTENLLPTYSQYDPKGDLPNAQRKKTRAGWIAAVGNGGKPFQNRAAGVKTGSGSGSTYYFIVTLDPLQAKEMSGAWEMYTQSILQFIDEVQQHPENYKDPTLKDSELLEALKQELTAQGVPSSSISGQSLAAIGAQLTSELKSDYFENYTFAAPYASAASTGTRRVFRFDTSMPASALLNTGEAYQLWTRKGNAIANATLSAAAKAFTQGAMQKDVRVTPPAGWGYEGIDSFVALVPSYWVAPGITGITDDSTAFVITDPDLLARWPFSYAQYQIAGKRGPVVGGAPCSLAPGSANPCRFEFGGPTLAPSTGGTEKTLGTAKVSDANATSVVNTLLSSYSPLLAKTGIARYRAGKAGSLWADPWLPGDAATVSPKWKYWHDTDPAFYTTLAPYMSKGLSLTLIPPRNGSVDVNALTGWTKGLERRFTPLVYCPVKGRSASGIIDTTRGGKGVVPLRIDPGQVQDILTRPDAILGGDGSTRSNLPDPYTKMLQGVQGKDYEPKKPFGFRSLVSDTLATLKNVVSGKKGASFFPYRSLSKSRSDMRLSVTKMIFSELNSKIYPMDGLRARDWALSRSIAISSGFLKLPDQTAHRQVWTLFGNPGKDVPPNAAVIPPVWPQPAVPEP